MQVDDVVVAGGRVFRITGIYLGGVGMQNLIGLQALSLKDGYAHGVKREELFVPEELVLAKGIYRKVDE